MSTGLAQKTRRCAVAVMAIALAIGCAPAALAQEDNARLGYITAENVNVRAEASLDGEVIGVQEGRDYVLVVGSSGSFYEIVFEGGTGYVSDEFSCVYDHEKGTVNASSVILRSEASTDSRKLDTMGRGDTVNIYEEEDGFYLVTYEKMEGYVSVDYVDPSGNKTSGRGNASSASVSSSSSGSSSGEGSVEEVMQAMAEEQARERPLVERSVTPGHYTEDELYLVAQLIYAEGKGGSDESYMALASVVYNRLQSSKFPDTIEEVCYQSGQFTVVRKDSFRDSKPSSSALNAVTAVFVEGNVVLPEEVLYFKSNRLSKDWGSSREYYSTIGANMYYT